MEARKAGLFVLAAALLASTAAAHAECSATARKTSFDLDGGDVIAEFDVTPRRCASRCSGLVDYRLHYKSKNGSDHFDAGKQEWKSADGSEVSIVAKGYESYCTERNLVRAARAPSK